MVQAMQVVARRQSVGYLLVEVNPVEDETGKIKRVGVNLI
jgi:arginase family enzyme